MKTPNEKLNGQANVVCSYNRQCTVLVYMYQFVCSFVSNDCHNDYDVFYNGLLSVATGDFVAVG